MSLPPCFHPGRYSDAILAARSGQSHSLPGTVTALTVHDSNSQNRQLAQIKVSVGSLGRRLPSDFNHGTIRSARDDVKGRILSAEGGGPGELTIDGLLPKDWSPPPGDRVILSPFDHLAALARWAKGLESTPPGVRRFLSNDILEAPSPPPLSTAGLGPLDDTQRLAVERCARESLLLWGPPGTGKTHTLAAAVASMRREGWRVAVVALSNAAVDVATLAIDDACTRMGMPLEPKELIRLGTPRHPELEGENRPHLLAFQRELAALNRKLASARKSLVAATRRIQQARSRGVEPHPKEVKLRASLLEVIDAAEEERRALLRQHIAAAQVLCTTAASFVLFEGLGELDAVLVDEGSQMPLALLYFLAASNPARLHVVGDPMQLPPITPRVPHRAPARAKEDVAYLFGTSRFSLAGLDGSKTTIEPAIARLERSGGLATLLVQRRMPKEIGELVSHLAYDGRLRHAASPRTQPSSIPDAPLIHVPAPGHGRVNSSQEEAELTRRIVETPDFDT